MFRHGASAVLARVKPRLILKPGREKSLLRRHPWIFSGAIARAEGAPQAGDVAAVIAANGRFLAWAGCNPQSQISARVWSWHEDEAVDAAFFQRRIERALAARALPGIAPRACRLVHGEADGLPGVIADRYGDTVVLQLGTAAAERWQGVIAAALMAATGAAGLYERSDADARTLEGLAPRCGLRLGAEPPPLIEIEEAGLRLLVDVRQGHKTGFYLDQRDNRCTVGRLAQGRRVLNCFCYSGGFSLHALANGAASVLSLDSSAPALALARRQLAHNGLPPERAEWREADVFKALRGLRDAGRQYDLIVLDPPKFAPTRAHAAKAARGYKDINLLAFQLLAPGGLLASFSCSSGISAELFRQIVSGAALDAGVDARIMHVLGQPADHPVLLSFPEGAYLKGLVCRVAD